MKVLLTCHFLEQLRGVEAFNYTLAQWFHKNGHEVDVFTHKTSEEMIDFFKDYASVITEMDSTKRYELGIFSHNTTYNQAYHLVNMRVFVSHGVISPLDAPPLDCFTVAVSEEAQRKYSSQYIMRNPINLERFYPKKTQHRGVCYITTEPKPAMTSSLMQLDISTSIVKGKFDIESVIQRAKYVVSTGRGVLESMACRIPAIVFGPSGFDGNVCDFEELALNNFSGRRYNKTLTPESLKREVSRDFRIEDAYNYVVEHHDVNKVMERLMRAI